MTETTTLQSEMTDRLIAVTLDEVSIARIDPKIDHERQVAIFDILEKNTFKLSGFENSGPFRLHLVLVEDRLQFQIANGAEKFLSEHELSLKAFRRILRDYFRILESYHQAIREGQPTRIEAIDVGRRALHDEGSQLLQDRLADTIEIDFDTARRLFTLLAALHWKG